MADAEIAIDNMMKHEGCIANDTADDGGLTKFGLSFHFIHNLPRENLKKYGLCFVDNDHLRQLIIDLDIPTAKLVYEGEFWNGHYFDKINNQTICNYYFDMAVNMGQAQATKLVQRAIWAHTYSMNTVTDDGVFGTQTLEEINHAGITLLAPLMSERANFYRLLAEKDNSQDVFLKGWLIRAYS